MAQAYLLTWWTKKRWLIITAVVLSAVPDIGRLFQSDPHNWNHFYHWAHNAWYLYLVPFWNLHIAEDWLMHKTTGGWKPWAIWLEIISWGVMLLIYWKYIKSENRNKQL